MLARQKSVNLSLGVRALAILLCFCASLCAEHPHIVWTRGGSIPSNVSVAYSPDGRLTASGGDGADPVVRLWTASDGSLLREIAAGSGVQDLAFSPDSQFIAAAVASSSGGSVKLFQVGDRHLVRSLSGGVAVACSPDGSLLAAGQAGSVGVYRVA